MAEAPLATRLVRAWPDLRGAARAELSRLEERRSFFYLMLACALLFVAGLATAGQQAAGLGRDDALAAVLSARAFGTLFILPLAFYALAAGLRLAALPFRGAGSFARTRLALFWSLLVSMPPVLVLALLAPGLFAAGLPRLLPAFLIAAVFALALGAALAEAEGLARAWPLQAGSFALLAAPILKIASIVT
jgi:hypothetical protein